MKTFKIKIYYYLGHSTYLIGIKHVYIPGAYPLYNYLMVKSSELDIDGILWGKPLAEPEKDEV